MKEKNVRVWERENKADLVVEDDGEVGRVRIDSCPAEGVGSANCPACSIGRLKDGIGVGGADVKEGSRN